MRGALEISHAGPMLFSATLNFVVVSRIFEMNPLTVVSSRGRGGSFRKTIAGISGSLGTTGTSQRGLHPRSSQESQRSHDPFPGIVQPSRLPGSQTLRSLSSGNPDFRDHPKF